MTEIKDCNEIMTDHEHIMMLKQKDYEYFAKRVETFESILEEIHSGDWNHSWTGMIIRLVDKHMPLIVNKEESK